MTLLRCAFSQRPCQEERSRRHDYEQTIYPHFLLQTTLFYKTKFLLLYTNLYIFWTRDFFLGRQKLITIDTLHLYANVGLSHLGDEMTPTANYYYTIGAASLRHPPLLFPRVLFATASKQTGRERFEAQTLAQHSDTARLFFCPLF